MNDRLRKLYEERATAYSAFQDVQARREKAGYEPTAEDGEAMTRSLDDVERLSAAIETEERAERMTSLMAAPQPTALAATGSATRGSDVSAFEDWVRRGLSGMTPENRAQLAEGRAQATNPDTAGGYLVPDGFLNRMQEELKAYGGVLGHAEILTTTSGNDLRFPSLDETGIKGAIIDENTAAGEQDVTFGNIKIGSFTYTSKGVRVPFQLLQDSAWDVASNMPRLLTERIGRGAAEHFAVGTGVGQPEGICTATKNVVTGAVSYDNLVDLEHAIDPAYRAGARYLINDDGVRAARKLKDGQGRPLWVPAMAGGVPSTINGRAYTVDNDLDAVVFGDIRAAYIVRLVRDAIVTRSEHRYVEFGQVGFWAWQRLDGRIKAQSAIALLKPAP